MKGKLTDLNRILEYYNNNNYIDAEILINEQLKRFPDQIFCLKLLAIIYGKTDRTSKALKVNKKLLILLPHDADTYCNLGINQKNLNMDNESKNSFEKAIQLNPYFGIAYYNLGMVIKKLKGSDGDVIYKYITALHVDPSLTNIYPELAVLLRNKKFNIYHKEAVNVLLNLLDYKHCFRAASLRDSVISLVQMDSNFIELSREYLKGNLLYDQCIDKLSKLTLLLKYMELAPIINLEIENILKSLRSKILCNIENIPNTSNLILFQRPLAIQCFLNEYIYGVSKSEINALKILENRIEDNLSKGVYPSNSEVACLASYKPLGYYNWIRDIKIDETIQKIYLKQYVEPNKEDSIKNDFEKLFPISNAISSKVRGQYEENPYPRWTSACLSTSHSIIDYAQRCQLAIDTKSIKNNHSPDVLVAGCGTGQHSVEVSTKFENCKVTAIDLSLSSLSYAKRLSDEFGINNIKYMHGDILDLDKLNTKFDVIECGGVLHHMSNPFDGWQKLVDCLKSGGLMEIGLYSKTARQHINSIKNEIIEKKIQPTYSEMISFRNYLIKSNKKHHKKIKEIYDFYNLSELRDLLFHIQEHQFTILQIQDYLERLNLSFCGFDNNILVNKFLERNSKEELFDLYIWNEFEKEYPDSFSGMYQFWCQKK